MSERMSDERFDLLGTMNWYDDGRWAIKFELWQSLQAERAHVTELQTKLQAAEGERDELSKALTLSIRVVKHQKKQLEEAEGQVARVTAVWAADYARWKKDWDELYSTVVDRAEAAEAKVERVKALCADSFTMPHDKGGDTVYVFKEDLEAALQETGK